MAHHKLIVRLKTWLGAADIPLFVFLVMFLHVSLVIKLAGLLFICVVHRKYELKQNLRQVPLFYPAMALFVLVAIAMNFYRGNNYLVLATLCLVYWLAAFVSLVQLRNRIEWSGEEKIHNSLRWFYSLNFLLTLLKFVAIMVEIGSLNPYVYLGQNFKYFASTGDHLRGITGDLSTVNMALSAFGVFYFLYRRDFLMSLACFLVVLVTTSNVGNIIIMAALGIVIFTHKQKLVKSICICYVAFMVIFIVKISPSNLNYLNNKVKDLLALEKKPLNLDPKVDTEKDKLIGDYVKQRTQTTQSKPAAKNNISELIAKKQAIKVQEAKLENERLMDEEARYKQKFVDYFVKLYGDTLYGNDPKYRNSPGKVISFKETSTFIKASPRHLLIGAGPGNFSSKLAFKASNLGVMGKYPASRAYVAPEFKENHLMLTLRYYMMSASEHSVINFPNSVYNQLLGEYGLLGILLFVLLYLWYFLKRLRVLTYSTVLLMMLLLFFLFDYWFESFSIVVMFELMALMDLKMNKRVASLEHS